jgi:hypothetical protein
MILTVIPGVTVYFLRKQPTVAVVVAHGAQTPEATRVVVAADQAFNPVTATTRTTLSPAEHKESTLLLLLAAETGGIQAVHKYGITMAEVVVVLAATDSDQ